MSSWGKVSGYNNLYRSPSSSFNLGQGLILLLSGPPGTGKTLTAEAGKPEVPQYHFKRSD